YGSEAQREEYLLDPCPLLQPKRRMGLWRADKTRIRIPCIQLIHSEPGPLRGQLGISHGACNRTIPLNWGSRVQTLTSSSWCQRFIGWVVRAGTKHLPKCAANRSLNGYRYSALCLRWSAVTQPEWSTFVTRPAM